MMNSEFVTGTVKDIAGRAKYKAELAVSHGQEIIHTGVETAIATREALKSGVNDTRDVLRKTRGEVRSVLKSGVNRIGDQLARLTTPTHKEQAVSRKEEIKAKKQRKTAARQEAELAV